MLQSIRDNSQGIVAKIIVGLIAITFALFGVESLVSLTAGSNAPAAVNGVEISQQELYQNVQLQRRQMLSQMGENADPSLLDDNLINNMVLEGLIDQAIVVQSAENQGLVFSDAMIDQLIVATRDFQVDGQFNREQFELALRNAGLTPLSYRDIVRKERISEQERSAFQLSAFTLQPEVDRIAKLDGQTRDIRYFTLASEPVRNGIQVSDDEVAEYYQANSQQFLTQEQVAIEYLLLDRDKIAETMSVSEEEVEQAYQTLVDNFNAQEERHAAHIMVEISDAQSDSDAKAKIDAIATRLNAGEAFETLAQSESDDLASAEQGGDLGVNGRGVFEAEFEDALFTLQKGAVSSPVRTEFGYHLIKLLDIVESSAPSFTQAQNELRDDLLSQKAEEEYVGQLEQLADVSFSSGDLNEPAELLQLEIQTTELFGRAGNEDEITSNPRILAAAFDAELINDGLNSTPVELDSGRSVVLRIVEHKLPRELALDEVAAEVKGILIEQKSATALSDAAKAIIADLKAGKSLASLSQGAEVLTVTELSRQGSGVPAELTAEVFKMPKAQEAASSFGYAPLADGNMAIVALDKVTDGAVELSEQERRVMGLVLSNQVGQQDYQDHVANEKSKAEIERL